MSGRSTTSIFGCTKPRIDIVPIDSELVDTATQAWLAFGKGRNPAASNFADCLSYALARRAGLPLFYKRMTSHKPMSKRSVDRLQISQVRALHTRSTISRQTVKPSCQAAGLLLRRRFDSMRLLNARRRAGQSPSVRLWRRICGSQSKAPTGSPIESHASFL